MSGGPYSDYLDPLISVLVFLRSYSRAVSSITLLVALLMYAFLRSPLAPWQHRLLEKEVSLEGRVDALVVLGYAVDHDNGVVTAPLASRLEQAFQHLCHLHTADTVVLSGGCSWSKADQLPSEAEVMQRWLTARWQGKPLPQTDDAPALAPSPCTRPLPLFILERTSTSTYTNAVNSLRLLAASHPDVARLLVVTSRFHQWRSFGVFSKVAAAHGGRWEVGMSAMESDVLDERVTQWDFWRELAAIVYYRIVGYI